jgi:hypothetical protein
MEPPTASQFTALVHDTPVKMLKTALAGLGVARIDHVEPFQRSANVLLELGVEYEPTAKQLVALEHDTALRETSVAPIGVGVATIDHVDPFQRSTSDLLAVAV